MSSKWPAYQLPSRVAPPWPEPESSAPNCCSLAWVLPFFGNSATQQKQYGTRPVLRKLFLSDLGEPFRSMLMTGLVGSALVKFPARRTLHRQHCALGVSMVSSKEVLVRANAQAAQPIAEVASRRLCRKNLVAMGHNPCLHFGADEHPCTYFDVHPGYRVFDHSHVCVWLLHLFQLLCELLRAWRAIRRMAS